MHQSVREYVDALPTGKASDWELCRDVVSVHKAVMANIGYPGREIRPGVITSLRLDRQCVMSDTPAELSEMGTAVRRATGSCLIHGLGLGIVAAEFAAKDEVTSVLVRELDPHVVQLVGAHLTARFPKVRIEVADALEYRPKRGERYDVIWHDIWSTICTEDLEDHRLLTRRWRRRCSWQGCWVHDRLLMYKAREDREDKRWRRFG